MMRRILRLKSASVLSCLMAALLVWPITTVVAWDNAISFSGQATVVKASVEGIAITLADTGPLPPSGGAQDATLLQGSVPGLLTFEVLHATTIAGGNQSKSEASVANLDLTAAGNRITADFLMSKAQANCGTGGPSVSGSSEVAGLIINGQSVSVSTQPNQTIQLPLGLGFVVINEQISSISGQTGDITVNALHVVVKDPVTGKATDVVISSAHADITCPGPVPPPPPPCPGKDFVTGGGWITGTPSGAKGNFGVAGGIKNGALWGHLTYIDHGSNGPKVKGTGVTAYSIVNSTTRHIEGTCEINGQGGFTYQVDVADNGEPGRNDTFSLRLSNGYSASGNLAGGNIQLHQPCQ